MLTAFLGGHFLFGETYLTESEALKIAFKDLPSPTSHYRALSKELKEELKKFVPGKDIHPSIKYWVSRIDGQVVKFAIIDNVIGKHEPITYMLTLDRDLAIDAVEILAYREARGWEVRNQKWRDQFESKKHGDSFRVGSSISNISGATLSCRSLARDIKKNLAILNRIIPQQQVKLEKSESKKESKKESKNKIDTRVQYAMGTILRISISDHHSSEKIDALFVQLFAEANRLNNTLSTYKSDSEITIFNKSNGEFQASSDFYQLISDSLRINKQLPTFDPAAIPLIELWKQFSNENKTPTFKQQKFARNSSSLKHLILSQGNRIKKIGSAQVSLNAIAKGFFLSKAKKIIAQSHIKNVLINFGGQLLAIGDGWVTKIEGVPMKAFPLKNVSISTSSISQNGYHVINPITLRPAKGIISMSVLHLDPTKADGLSTGLMALSIRDAIQFANKHHIDFIAISAENKIYNSTNFEPYIIRASAH